MKIVHCIEKWLPKTMVWLNNQLNFLMNDVENIIVCQELVNFDLFKKNCVYSLKSMLLWQQMILKLQCKVGFKERQFLHLGLLESIVKRVKPEILHSHFGHYGWINGRVAKKYGLKHIVHFYGADVSFIPKSDARWLTRYVEMGQNVDLVLCEGPFMAKCIAKLGIPASKIKVHRLGIDLETVRFVPRKYNRGEKLRFLIAASFREKKGIPYALEALGKLRNTFHNFEVTIIGDAGNQEREKKEKEKILQAIKSFELGDCVRLLGYQPHDVLLQEAYQHHIFLSPSVTSSDGDTEGGAPIGIIEMAASGMPVVSTTHCDIPFVLSDMNRKILVKERDSNRLCESIVGLMESGWADLVNENRAFIEGTLDARKQGEYLYKIYLDTLNS
jgi:colanic acid/amylovoran biosynthesis glycosyltransferase